MNTRYSRDFLDQMEADLRQLADDYQKANGASVDIGRLVRAADVVRRIRQEDEDED